VTALLAPVALALAALAADGEPCDSAQWPLWQRYAETFITPAGRVVDPAAGDRTTSEGQAYALFFALVANDRPLYDRVLAWTRDNLAGGDLSRTLPGWHWGRDGRGRWRLLDRHPASDADLWLAYTLLEAGRLWDDPGLGASGRAVLANVVRREVVNLPGFGPMLMPGPVGFALRKSGLWRLNPSYLPLQIVRRFAALGLPGPWTDLAPAVVRMIREGAGHGFAPDWVGFDRARGFVADPVAGPIGSYDAIRVYLWAGMLPREEGLRPALQGTLGGPWRWLGEHGTLPEKIDVVTGQTGDSPAPPGYFAALLPEARMRGDQALVRALEERLEETLQGGLYGDPPAYYDQNLALFARGFVEGRFRFDGRGEFVSAWGSRWCAR
jgi:endoglucanase